MCLLIFISGMSKTLLAVTFTVTKIADTNDNVCDTDCSLREAISVANTTATDDEINFDAGVFGSFPQTIILSGTQLTITNNGTLTINGTVFDRGGNCFGDHRIKGIFTSEWIP